MPWTPKQVRLFYAVAAGKAKGKGISRKKARTLLREDPKGTRPAKR
jgi:hypothetical protein